MDRDDEEAPKVRMSRSPLALHLPPAKAAAATFGAWAGTTDRVRS